MVFNIIFISVSYFSIMEYLIRKYIIPVDQEFKRSRIYKNKETKNTIWGDSATLGNINYLADFSNFSEGYQCYREISSKLKNYYSKNTKGGKVILQLALNGFSPERENCESTNDRIKELYLSKDNKRTFYMSKNYFRTRSFSYLKNYLRNNFTIVTTKNQIFNQDGSLSFLAVYDSKNINIDSKGYNKNHLFIPRTDFKESDNFKALLQIIDFLEKKNIDVCLISTPVHKDFFKYDVPRYRFQEVFKSYKKLSADKKLKYINYTDYFFEDKYYRDTTHLNKKGAVIFTKIVGKECFDI